MLESVPIPFQAILWPLLGAALVLALGRWLPTGIRQLLAVLSASATLAAIWSLRAAVGGRAEIFWEPLNLFRMSPVLVPDGLSLALGITLTGVTVAAFVGIRGQDWPRGAWHGLMLVALAGCLIMAMAGNLLALVMGSALIDLALVFSAVTGNKGSEPTGRFSLAVAIPGTISTLVLLLAALEMEAQTGHASLLSRNLSDEALVFLGVAGLLRSFVYPLHPRDSRAPESAVALLLPVGAGLYLLARVQSLAPVLSDQPWMLALAAVALLAGGLLAWSRGTGLVSGVNPQIGLGQVWVGLLVHQTGYALVFFLLLVGGLPWPLISLLLALGALIIWWAGSMERGEASRSRALAWIGQRMEPLRTRAASYTNTRLPRLKRWRDSWLGRHGAALLPAVAVASLIGAPLTAGARGRWLFYAALLKRGDWTLLVALAADALLVAGLWVVLGLTIKWAGERRRGALTLLAAMALVVPILWLGLAPGVLQDGLALTPVEPPRVSAWGLGLLYLLPWLLGVWLARIRGSLSSTLARIEAAVNLNWLYRALGWAGQGLTDAVHWLGRVGEGEGWWGWALIILALGILLLAAR